ncbi:GntR family transcriptional regulator [Agromyces albus]|uniref:GntR family transcriptional regulator n=1 Tax=Agromyces albus TaxID=205332 RepID=UPI0013E9879F|nr:GntR family transcriptional regulator [Agromyces albus]
MNDEVYERLRQWITTGTLLPGMKISIRSIADSFGVSTMPVREALRRLESDGLVVFGRRSVTVTLLSTDQVQQVFQIRLRLEQLAAEWAIDQVDEDDIADLESILAKMDRPDIGVDEWRHLNQDFHRRFYDCARSPHLLELIRNVWDKVEPYMAIYASTVQDFAEAQRQHSEMLELIRGRRLSALLTATAEHLDYTARTVVAALEGAAPPK